MAHLAKLAGSRKGKKAWRKNVDITDVEAGLELARERKRTLGDDDDEDFVIDTTPADVNVKKPKYQEILENKLKVPALVNNQAEAKRRKFDGVLKKQLKHLIRMNGGKYGEEDKVKAQMDKDGLSIIDLSKGDLWDDPEPVDDTPEELKKNAITSITKPKHAPRTMAQAPIQIAENELTRKEVHAGKSYNPALELWKALIEQEYTIEAKKEAVRQQLAEFTQKLERLAAELTHQEGDGLSDEEEEEREEKEEEAGDYSLSVNAPVKNKKKTKTQRNKLARHQHQEKLREDIKELKDQVKQLLQLDDILDQQKLVEPASFKGKTRKTKKLSKYRHMEAPLEVKLSDELTLNLRTVKPEGNLLHDTMLGLQSTGKVEARMVVAKKKKAVRITEKWSFKDFK